MSIETRIREGDRIPSITLRTREDGEWKDVTTDQLFGGKRVVVFSLPGAFTPTCSSAHLPRYEELSQLFYDNGVDDILCVSVNDAFVMEAWGREQGAKNVQLVPDGNGELTEAMGMLVDKSDLGFGKRSWRYAMVINDGVVEKLFVEPDKPGDPYEVSDADTVLAYVAPRARPGSHAALIVKEGCPHCARAKRALEQTGIPYEQVVLGRDATTRSLEAMTGRLTTPQAWIDGEYVGGADEVEQWVAMRKAG